MSISSVVRLPAARTVLSALPHHGSTESVGAGTCARPRSGRGPRMSLILNPVAMPSTQAPRSERWRNSVHDSQIVQHAHVFGSAARIHARLVHKIATFHRLFLGQCLN